MFYNCILLHASLESFDLKLKSLKLSSRDHVKHFSETILFKPQVNYFLIDKETEAY